MGDSITEAAQHQQQQQQKKKRAKNKKGAKAAPEQAVGAAAAAATDKASTHEVNANGLSEQLAHELHINNHTASDKGRKGSKLANGVSGKEEVPHQVNGHDSAVTAAEPTANGSSAAESQQSKKTKSKSNKLKNKDDDNCHNTCVEKGAAKPATAKQESEAALKNGFCTAQEEKEAESSSEQTTVANAKQDNLEANTKTEEPGAEQQASAACSTPATTASNVNPASTPDAAGSESVANPSTEPKLDLSNVQIEYKEYESELQMHDIMRLIQAELSEPYSIYTYRYFIYNWPKLCFLAAHGNEYVGAIVCKLDMHLNVRRGYIAMLAVRKEYRKLKIGTTLVQKAIEAMLADNADEVVLETEMRNVPALRLYENLGFVRDKRLFRYYLNGVDALRLKLWFR